MSDLSLLELKEIESLDMKLNQAYGSNAKKIVYYSQENKVKDLGIQTPVRLQALTTVLGWPQSAVDTLLERLTWRGFYTPDTEDPVTKWLNDLFYENEMESQQKFFFKDSFITGAGFISAGMGDEDLGEPEVVWQPESPQHMTVSFSHRYHKVESAFKRVKVGDQILGVLWTDEATIQLTKVNKKWVETSRDEHELGFVSVVPFFNNADSIFPRGRSEITKSIRDLTDSGMRTLLGAEVSREFFGNPLRAAVGMDLEDISMMQESRGKFVLKQKAGDILAIPSRTLDNGTVVQPTIQELSGGDPTKVMSLIEPYGRLVAREIGVPPSYFGFDTVNPSSAEAINAGDQKLIKKAQSRLPEFKRAIKKLAFMSLSMSDKQKPEDWPKLEAVFDRVDTITPSAATDRLSKLKAAGLFDEVMPDWVYRHMDLGTMEISETKEYVKRKASQNLIQQLSAGVVPNE